MFRRPPVTPEARAGMFRDIVSSAREVFADRDLILTEGIDYSESETISGFCAIDEKVLTDCKS